MRSTRGPPCQQIEQRAPGRDHLPADVVNQIMRALAAEIRRNAHHHRFRHDQSARDVEIGAHLLRIDLKPGVDPRTRQFKNALIHYTYPTLTYYIGHMNRYSSLGAENAISKGHRSFSILNIVLRPLATFFYNYVIRLGFLDGREGLLLHLYHAAYVSWKYAKAWELARNQSTSR